MCTVFVAGVLIGYAIHFKMYSRNIPLKIFFIARAYMMSGILPLSTKHRRLRHSRSPRVLQLLVDQKEHLH